MALSEAEVSHVQLLEPFVLCQEFVACKLKTIGVVHSIGAHKIQAQMSQTQIRKIRLRRNQSTKMPLENDEVAKTKLTRSLSFG